MTALLAEKDARITDLRAQVEAQRLQIEAANRATAEAHAALRESLKMSNRALTEGAAKPVEIDGNNDRHIEAQVLVADEKRAPETMPQVLAETNAHFERSKGLRGWLLRLLNG